METLVLVIKAALEWAHTNKEGFWQGTVLAMFLGALWAASKVVGKGKAMAGGVLDTYNRMAEDLQKRMDEEREDNARRLATLKEELEEYRKAVDQSRDQSMAMAAQLTALKLALAREGALVVTNPDGSLSIQKVGG